MAKQRVTKQAETTLTEREPQLYEIPVEGSLGLLALGYRGLEAWRAKKEEAKNATSNTK